MRALVLPLLAVLLLATLPQSSTQQEVAPVPTQRPTARRPSPTTRKPTGHIYVNNSALSLSKNEQQIIVGVMIILVFLGMALELAQPEILFLFALVFVMLAQILTIDEVLSGFANESMITIGALFIVVGGVEKSHIVDWLARKTFGSTGSLLVGKLRFYVTCFCLSVFFNNTPLVAILMPVVRDWARLRNDSASQVLMPLSYSVLSGSFISMIGTSTNLTVQGLMQADRGYSFPFFAPAPFGIPLFCGLLIYMLVGTSCILPHGKGGLIKSATERAETMVAQIKVTPKSRVVGKSLEFAMTSLGLAVTRVIKIRRAVEPDFGITSIRNVTRTPFLDSMHIRDCFLKFTSRISQTKNAMPEQESSEPNEEGETEKQYIDIIAPTGNEAVEPSDIIFVSHAQDVVEKLMKSVAGESNGLEVLETSANLLPGFGSELVELSISDTSPLLGTSMAELHGAISETYGCGVISIRHKEWGGSEEAPVGHLSSQLPPSHANLLDEDAFKPSTDVGVSIQPVVLEEERRLTYGDLVLVVTAHDKVEELAASKDFFVVTTVGSLPKPMNYYSAFPALVFLVMLILVATDMLTMVAASLTVATFYLVGGWVKADEIPELVDIRLLMLIATSLSFARSMTASGLAITISSTISSSDPSQLGALFLVYAVTLVLTELVSNNAAAALMYPIAVSLADSLKSDFKPFAMCVLIASTAGFMSPIGYQTHVMVWAPGGYKFRDFVLYGLFPDVFYWIVGCLLISAILPFDGTITMDMFKAK